MLPKQSVNSRWTGPDFAFQVPISGYSPSDDQKSGHAATSVLRFENERIRARAYAAPVSTCLPSSIAGDTRVAKESRENFGNYFQMISRPSAYGTRCRPELSRFPRR